MEGYIEYVHNIPVNRNRASVRLGLKNKDINIFSSKMDDIKELKDAIVTESSQYVADYISEHLDLEKYFRSIIFSTSSKSYVDNINFDDVHAIVNFKPINEICYINEHFKSVNKLLPDGGIYIGRTETYWERQQRIYDFFGKKLGFIMWLIDCLLNRFLPKIRFIEPIYKFFTNDHVHPKSIAEVLGRLVYCGFDIIDFEAMDGLLYFVVIKTKEPLNEPDPSYHAIVKLKRIGKGGNFINVYKFRTMHPYSEYLQDYIIKMNGYNKSGKPANDFRVARWGKYMRKFWIDEIPQIINVFKGEMKLFGVRPLSKVRFDEFPDDVQQERIKYKPGCIPPYVALNMPDSSGNIEAERIYLRDLKKSPNFTDIRYLIKAVNNIITNKIRSS